MTLEDAIKHAKEVAKENDDSANEFYRVSKLKLETHPDRKRAEDGYVECKKCADEHRQLASWLRELKELRIENKALKNRCADFEHGAPCRYCPLDCEFRKHEFEVRQHRESHQTSSDCGMAERIKGKKGEG